MGTTARIGLRKKTILYKDCSELSIYNYIQILQNKDLKFLVKKGAKPKDSILENKLEEINKELAELRGEETMTNKFDLISYREELILKCHFGITLIDIIQTQVALKIIAQKTFNDLIAELESWGFEVNKEIPLIDALIEIKSEIDALQTTIESLTQEIYPESENELENEEKQSNSMFSLYEMLLIYQRILKIDKINPKKTSLLEFSVMEKQVKELSKKKQTNTQE